MASVVIPFLMSMLLGRTIDLKSYTIGGDIYDHTEFEETPLHLLNSTYNILQPNVYPYSYIGLPADLVLRIKSNSLSSASGALGLDGLLRETSWKSKGVVIAVSTLYQTLYREIKPDAQLLENWTTRVSKDQTHYAASLVYGGWNLVLYRLECNVPEDEAIVRRLLIENLREAGQMNKDVVERWKEVLAKFENSEELNGEVNVKVKSYSSAPSNGDLSTPDGVMKVIENFPNDVGKLGQPLFMELKPLHELDNRFPAVTANHVLDREMEKLDELFDDLREASTSMRHWISSSLAEFTDDEEERISDLFEYISRCLALFKRIAADASIYDPMDVNYLKTAMLMYSKGLTKETNSYRMLFRRLKEDLDPQCEDNFRHRIRGVLQVALNEKLELGEMKDGLEQCKAECLAEPKCRAIGYAEEVPVLDYQSPIAKRAFRIIKKFKQCCIYFRSSATATVIPSKTEKATQIYDRNCY